MSWLVTFYENHSKEEIEKLLVDCKIEAKLIPFSKLEITPGDISLFTGISNDYMNELHFWNAVYKIDLRDKDIKCPDKNKGWLATQLQMYGLPPEKALTNWDKYDLLPLHKVFTPQFSNEFFERYKELNKDVLCYISKFPVNSFYVCEELYRMINLTIYFDGNISK